jgi:hypothetical protein
VDSTGKLDMLRSIGADQVIDYTREDFTTIGETYDIIFDVVGKTSFSRSVRSLKHYGRYLLANAGLSQMVRGRWTSMRSSKKVIVGAASEKTEDLLFLKELIEAGKIQSGERICGSKSTAWRKRTDQLVMRSLVKRRHALIPSSVLILSRHTFPFEKGMRSAHSIVTKKPDVERFPQATLHQWS